MSGMGNTTSGETGQGNQERKPGHTNLSCQALRATLSARAGGS
jgi:hypothetical protein